MHVRSSLLTTLCLLFLSGCCSPGDYWANQYRTDAGTADSQSSNRRDSGRNPYLLTEDASTDASEDASTDASFVAPLACDGPEANVRIAEPLPQELLSWVQDSHTIRGTVTRLGTSLSPAPRSNPENVAVLRITDVVDDPSGFFDAFLGTEIAVVTETPIDVSVGFDGYFFVQSRCIGNQTDCDGAAISVTQQHRVEASELPSLPNAVRQTRAFLERRAVWNRLRGATLAVVATTTNLTAMPQSEPLSEHSPEWQQVHATVQRMVCGAPETFVLVRFNGSRDVSNADGPRLSEGQTAVLLLRPDTQTGAAEPGYILVDRLDVADLEQAEALTRMLNNPPALDL